MEELLTIDELAAKLKVGKAWVYERTRPGAKDQIPHLHVGGLLRFKASNVLKYLERQQKEKQRA